MAQTEFKYKTGDIVKLKSGGPNMTVSAWNEHREAYHCKWFAGSKEQGGYFNEDTLTPVTEEPKN